MKHPLFRVCSTTDHVVARRLAEQWDLTLVRQIASDAECHSDCERRRGKQMKSISALFVFFLFLSSCWQTVKWLSHVSFSPRFGRVHSEFYLQDRWSGRKCSDVKDLHFEQDEWVATVIWEAAFSQIISGEFALRMSRLILANMLTCFLKQVCLRRLYVALHCRDREPSKAGGRWQVLQPVFFNFFLFYHFLFPLTY